MMTRSLVKVIIVFLFLSFTASVSAQYDDFRSWWNVDLSKKLSSDLKAELEIGQRFRENSLRYDRSLATFELEYEVLKNLTLECAYRFILVRNKQLEMETRYRVHSNVAYVIKISAFSIKFRDQIQYGYNDLNTFDSFYYNKLTNRSKVNMKYSIFGTPLALHASYEFYLDLNSPVGVIPSAQRIKTGVEMSFSGKSNIDLSYILENELNTINPLRSNIIVVSYSYKL